MYHNAIKIYNTLLCLYFNDYDNITEEGKEKMGESLILIIYLLKVIGLLNRRKKMQKKVNHSPKKPLLKEKNLRWQKVDHYFDEAIDIPDMPPLEGDEEEMKEGKWLKILTPKKLLTRLDSIISTYKSWKQFIQIKKWNKTNIISFVKHHYKIIKKFYNNLMKSV